MAADGAGSAPGSAAPQGGSTGGAHESDRAIGEHGTHDDLRLAVGHGLKWSFINMAVARLATIASGIVLARILVPEDYGVFAPALAAVNILFGLNDLGMLLALVRWKGDLREAAKTAQTIAVSFSVVLYAACFVGAPWFSTTLGSPDSANVLRVLALTVLVDGVTTVGHALLVRAFRQDRFARAELSALPFAIATSIVLASAGFGVWSLALGQIVGNLISGIAVVRAAPFRVGFGFSPAIARQMLAYGAPLAGTSLVEYCLLNADYLVISRALDPAAVGIYLLAFNVSQWPLSIVTDTVRRVSIAGFATLEGDADAVKSGFAVAFAALIGTALPLLVAQGVFASALIALLYGNAWQRSGNVLELLVILSGARLAIGFILDLLVGLGRTRLSFVLQAAWLCSLVVALEIGVRAGELRGVAIAHAVTALAFALPLFLLAARCVGADLAGIARRLPRPLLAASGAFAAGLVVRQHLESPLALVLAGGSTVLGTYVLLVLRPRDVALARRRVRRLRGYGPDPVVPIAP